VRTLARDMMKANEGPSVVLDGMNKKRLLATNVGLITFQSWAKIMKPRDITLQKFKLRTRAGNHKNTYFQGFTTSE
jgi:hypothetical protein